MQEQTEPTIILESKLSLAEKLEILPREPGCYLFKDNKNKIIYVGKAKILRNRVRSYFSGRDDGRYQYELLVSRIHDLEVIVTRSEIEALVLEANLIQRHHPRFNIDVHDDRTYPYLKVTHEPFPRIFLTRNPKEDGSKYYGPLTDVTQIKDTLKALLQACKVRTCNLRINEASIKRKVHRVCLEYHIDNCEGPCEGKVTEERYHQGIQTLIQTINGREHELVELLETRMRNLAKELKFEEASRVRDQLAAIQSLCKRQHIQSLDTDDRDVFGLAQEDRDACITVMRIRSGRLVGRQHSHLSHVGEENPDTIWVRYLADYYLPATRIPPEKILLPDPLIEEEQQLLEDFLSEKRGRKVHIEFPQRGERVRLLELAKQNARLLLDEHRLARDQRDRTPHSLAQLKEVLQLAELPQVIECFDNSNLFGADPVASMVHFYNARPVKKEYRHYKIKTVEGIDDFASMQEVVGRRYRRLLKERQTLPDLVLIDGGIGQLNAARRVLDELGLQKLTAIGLAKRFEEIYLPGQGGPITLPKTSSALKLLMKIRDEAHRFAVTFHRKLHRKSTVSTTLTSLSGIGEAKAAALLKHFGSLKRLKSATPAQIAEIPGFSKESGEKLLLALLKDTNGK